MDWMHIGEAIAALGFGAWGYIKKRKSAQKDEMVKVVIDTALSRVREEMDSMAKIIAPETRTGVLGTGLLAELSIKHDLAIEEGKRAALREWEQKFGKTFGKSGGK